MREMRKTIAEVTRILKAASLFFLTVPNLLNASQLSDNQCQRETHGCGRGD
jgi:hypothetical protein